MFDVPIAVLYGVRRLPEHNNMKKYETPSYLPRFKPRLAIADTLIGFSLSCVSRDILP
jgi:hypothetical protein